MAVELVELVIFALYVTYTYDLAGTGIGGKICCKLFANTLFAFNVIVIEKLFLSMPVINVGFVMIYTFTVKIILVEYGLSVTIDINIFLIFYLNMIGYAIYKLS